MISTNLFQKNIQAVKKDLNNIQTQVIYTRKINLNPAWEKSVFSVDRLIFKRRRHVIKKSGI
jgi:hypothetical protein